MTGGYTGKILRVNLTTKSVSTIDTAKYEEFGGGYGMGAAIFWDLAVAPGEWDLKDAFDPRNVLPIMTGPFAATGVPGGGRTSVCGLSPETFPTCEFWRGNLGGRFGTTMKLAGWDGVVVEGKADKAGVDQHHQRPGEDRRRQRAVGPGYLGDAGPDYGNGGRKNPLR